MDVLITPLTDIRRALLAARTPPLEAVRSTLCRARTYLTVATAMREVAPEKAQQAMTEPIYLSSLEDISTLEDQAARLLSNLFPVHEIAVEEMLAEGDGLPVIPVPCLNLAGSWDDFEEILQEPGIISESWSAIAFAHYFVRGIAGEAWQRAAEHFHWPLAEAPELLSRADKRLDWERFTALLQEHDLADFEACFALAFWDTGSVFFDLDDEQLWNEAFEFKAETIRSLAEEWEKGEAVLDTALAACGRANVDPTLYFRLLDVLAAAVTEEPLMNNLMTLTPVTTTSLAIGTMTPLATMTSDLITAPQAPEFNAEAELYFLPGGHYLFRRRSAAGVVSKFVTAPDVAAAFTGQEMDSGWLPPGVMRIGRHALGPWYVYTVPAQRMRLALTTPEGVQDIEIPIPHTLLIGYGESCYLAALREDHFDPTARLCHAPFPNLYNELRICWGDNTPPEVDFQTAAKTWNLFFDAPFNGHLTGGKSQAYPDDVRQQLLALAGSKRRRYPARDLVETRYTTNSLLEALQRGVAMIGYLIAHQGQPLPPAKGLFQYILAANGVFIRASKPGLKVLLKVGHILTALRGLENLTESVEVERIPQTVLETILQLACEALPNEILFYLKPFPGGWQIDLPEQAMTPGSVHPLDPDDPACAQALCELHSHNTMPAFFSATDNAEESFGFRIYAVIGRVDTAPEIQVRVGVYGHLLEIPPEWVFDLPDAFLRPAPEYPFPIGDNHES